MAGGTLVIGRPSKDIQKDYNRLLPIAGYLGARLAAQGVTAGDVAVSGMNSAEEAGEMVKSGRIDIVLETPYSALRIIKLSGATPILALAREGQAEYGSVVFTRKDSGLDSLDKLRGKLVAFEDPGSTSGFFLPLRSLKEAGLDMAPLAGPGLPVPAGKTGYVFAGGELNVSSWVFSGKVHAGAYSESNWSSPEDNPDAYREQMHIIHRTGKVPRMLVLVRPGLPPGLVEAVKKLLLSMPDDPAGREALKPYKITGFTDILDPAAFTLHMERSL